MTAAVVLAAGESSRLGRPKQLLRYRGVTLLRHTLDCARQGGCDPVLTVVGAHRKALAGELEAARATAVVNEHWQRGLASSIRTGVVAAQARCPELRALLLLACDQPGLTVEIVRALRQRVETGEARLAACSYAETIGVPAAFDRSLFPELLALSSPGGAKPILESHRSEMALVAWPEGAVDVDTPDDARSLDRE